MLSIIQSCHLVSLVALVVSSLRSSIFDFCLLEKILNLILHKCAGHQAFCVIQYFTSDHATDSLVLLSIFSQKLQIITQWQPYHIKSSPWWLASSIPHDIFHHTLSQAVFWIWFTWIVRQVQFLMLYDLQYAICNRILAIHPYYITSK